MADPNGSLTATEELSAWASRLRLSDVPARVVAMAKSQVLSQLAAIRAGLDHPLGRRIVRALGPPFQADARRSACVLAALGSWLNLDDTAYAGHLAASTISVPLAYANARGLTGRALLTAVIAANECAARITASATLGALRGQSALHTHLAGAVCGRLRSEAAPAKRWTNALGLAFSTPPWPVMRGFLGSDAKLLSTVAPVRIAMDACDAAAAGLAGAPDILEHPDGFLARFAAVPLPEAVTTGLGRRWHTETVSFKVRPGGPGIDSAVDCAVEIHRRAPKLSPSDVVEVVVDASLYTLLVGQRANRYIDGPRSPLSALLLTVPYPVATGLLTGSLTTADFAAPAVRERRRWALASKVRLQHDPQMTRSLLRSVAPFGEAVRQAGARSTAWLREFGGDELVGLIGELGAPCETFEDAHKVTAARVVVRLRGGEVLEHRRDIPVGAIGPQTRAAHAALTREKFLAYGGSAQVADACERLERLSAGSLAQMLATALPRT
jgi:2-methylcitrate dehydratase PrpD